MLGELNLMWKNIGLNKDFIFPSNIKKEKIFLKNNL